MITTTLAILLIIRTFFLILAGCFFLLGAGLGWYERSKGGRNGLTDCLIKFTVSTGVVFIFTAMIVMSETARLFIGNVTAEIVTSALVMMSIMALLMMMYSGLHLAMDLLINANSVSKDKRQAKK